MTGERRRSIVILVSTLLVGLLLGLLIPGLVRKLNNRPRMERARIHQAMPKGEWFAGTLEQVLQPDSAQTSQIRPIAQWAEFRIDSIESAANEQMSLVLDSVKNQLEPILTPEQQERLDAFDSRAQGHWRRRAGRH